ARRRPARRSLRRSATSPRCAHAHDRAGTRTRALWCRTCRAAQRSPSSYGYIPEVATSAEPGATPLDQLRANVRETPPAPEVMEQYLATVRAGAHALTDEDVQELKSAGVSEDEIFEQTVAAAISEGLLRLDAAEAVIR